MNNISICLELSQYNWRSSGIGEYERQMARGLYTRFGETLCGSSHQVRVEDAPFRVDLSRFPYDWLYSNSKARFIPFPYHWLNGRFKRDDVYLFFRNRIPYQKINGKVIVVIHDLIPLKVSGYSQSYIDEYKCNVAYSLKRADCVVTVSEFSRRDIAETFDFDSDRIMVVPPGVDYERFSKVIGGEESLLAKFGVPKIGDYLLYFGSHAVHKNLPLLFRAYASLPSLVRQCHPLVLNGKPDVALNDLIQSLAITENVYFTGFVSEDLKPILYRHARAFAFLSNYEGFGMPIIEAMAAGIPVVCSNCASLPEVAGDAALVVNTNDFAQVVNNLFLALKDEATRKCLVEAGYSRASQFSWKKSVSKMEKLIQECGGKGGRR